MNESACKWEAANVGQRVKEKNMMSSLRTHPSELSGCSESAIYFINIIPPGLTSRLPLATYSQTPYISMCWV